MPPPQKCIWSCYDLVLWHLTLKTFSAMHIHTIFLLQFHWNPSTKYRDIASREVRINGHIANIQMDGRKTDGQTTWKHIASHCLLSATEAKKHADDDGTRHTCPSLTVNATAPNVRNQQKQHNVVRQCQRNCRTPVNDRASNIAQVTKHTNSMPKCNQIQCKMENERELTHERNWKMQSVPCLYAVLCPFHPNCSLSVWSSWPATICQM